MNNEESIKSIYVQEGDNEGRIGGIGAAQEIAYAEKTKGRDAALELEKRLEHRANTGLETLSPEEEFYVEVVNKFLSKPDMTSGNFEAQNPYYYKPEGFTPNLIDTDEEGYPIMIVPAFNMKYSQGGDSLLDSYFVMCKKGVFCMYLYDHDNKSNEDYNCPVPFRMIKGGSIPPLLNKADGRSYFSVEDFIGRAKGRAKEGESCLASDVINMEEFNNYRGLFTKDRAPVACFQKLNLNENFDGLKSRTEEPVSVIDVLKMNIILLARRIEREKNRKLEITGINKELLDRI